MENKKWWGQGGGVEKALAAVPSVSLWETRSEMMWWGRLGGGGGGGSGARLWRQHCESGKEEGRSGGSPHTTQGRHAAPDKGYITNSPAAMFALTRSGTRHQHGKKMPFKLPNPSKNVWSALKWRKKKGVCPFWQARYSKLDCKPRPFYLRHSRGHDQEAKITRHCKTAMVPSPIW